MDGKKQSPGGAEKKREKFFLHLKNGRRFLQNNNLVEAKDELETALEFRPNDDKAQNLMAMVLFKLEQYPRAIGIFRKLIERNPGVPTLYTNLGLAYLKQENYDEAMEALSKAIENQADNQVAHNYLGLVYSKLGRYEEAKDEFVRANSPKMADLMQEKLAEIPQQQEKAPQMEEVVGGREEEMEEQRLLESQPEELPKKVVPVAEKEEISLEEITKRFTEVEEEPPEEKRERAAPVVAAVKGPEAISLTALSKSLEITKGEAPTLRMINDNLFQVVLQGGQVHARLTGLVAFEGDLIFEPEFKKFKGKATNAYFGTKDNPVVKITGEGQLLFSPENLKLHLFHLEDEMLYLNESAVFAFQEGINWENGRIHGEEERDVNLVQFRGQGIIALATKEKLASIQITSAYPLLVDLFSLTGWYGKILPKIIALSVPSEAKKGKKIMVELKGEGSVLLEESCKS